MKKKEKKLKNENDIDDLIGDEEFGQGKENEDEEMEKYADKVIEDEYKKFGKDVDDDDFGDYQNDREQGRGVYEFAGGTYYGGISQGQMTGDGMLISSDGTKKIGNFNQAAPVGQFALIGKDGKITIQTGVLR